MSGLWTRSRAVNDCIANLNALNLGECRSQLNLLRADLVGDFSIEHIRAAAGWEDWQECLVWAIEARATVKEMVLWHNAKNGEGIFAK
jgi:hypothetical protein